MIISKLYKMVLLVLISISPAQYGFVVSWATCQEKQTSRLPEPILPECLGVFIRQITPKKLDLALDLGFHYVKKDMVWASIEKTEHDYDFNHLRDLVAELKTRNMRGMFILDYGNLLYEADRSIVTENGRKAYAQFAAKAVETFKDFNVIWEIWNEPNNSEFWGPTPDPIAYAKAAIEAAQAMHEVNPNAIIAAPAVGRNDWAFFEKTFEADLLNYIDAVSIHLLKKGLPEDSIGAVTRLRKLIELYAPTDEKHMPIIVSEWGYSLPIQPSQEQLLEQAKFMIRGIILNMYQKIPLTIWFQLQDNPISAKNYHRTFGLYTSQMVKTPSCQALGVLVSSLKGWNIDQRISVNDAEYEGIREDDFIFSLQRENQTRIVAWTIASPHYVTIHKNKAALAVVDLINGKKAETKIESAKIQVLFTDSPQLLTFN